MKLFCLNNTMNKIKLLSILTAFLCASPIHAEANMSKTECEKILSEARDMLDKYRIHLKMKKNAVKNRNTQGVRDFHSLSNQYLEKTFETGFSQC